MIEQEEFRNQLNKSTSVVAVAPDESIDTIIKNIKDTKAERVTLLIPDGSAALQSRKACMKMREVLDPDGIDVVLFTVDEAVIRTAEKCNLTFIEIDPDAMMPAASTPKATPTPAQPAPSATPIQPIPPRTAEEDFLASLESMPAAPTTAQNFADDDIFAQQTLDKWAFDDEPVAAPKVEVTPSSRPAEEDSWDFDAFNDLSDAISGNTDNAAVASAAVERPRIRPEDIELSADDLTRQDPKIRRAKSEAIRYEEKAAAKAEAKANRKGPAIPTWLLALIALGLIALLAWLFFFKNRGTVGIVVTPPANRAGAKNYNDVKINFQDQPITDPSSYAIQGRMIEVPVSVTINGTVTEATLQPDKTASGTIQVFNRNPQAYTLPVNTKVKTTDANGQELVYNVSQETVVPAATATIFQVTSGVANVPIVAILGGEKYNLNADPESTRWNIEGFEGALFAVNPEPIAGGTSTLLKIPSQAEIAPLLTQAMPQFQNKVVSEMQVQLQSGENLAGIQFVPTINQLAQDPTLYDVQTRPIPDTDGGFEAIITASFRSLAVKGNFNAEMQRAVANALKVNDPTFNPETTEIVSQTLSLGDPGANLLVANIQTAPKSQTGIPAETITMIQNNLAGVTIEEARAKLEKFQQEGVIGSFELPDSIQQLPEANKISITVRK